MEPKLETLLKHTADFHQEARSLVHDLVPLDETRAKVAFQAGLLSIEHADAAFALIRLGFPQSAFVLLRSQYECLVRGNWLLYRASDAWVEKLSDSLTAESAKRANEAPLLADMLKSLESSSIAPLLVVGQLRAYHDATWKTLASYSHGGLHPLSRTVTGYPDQLIFNAVKDSNSILLLATLLLSSLTGNTQEILPVRKLNIDFADCLSAFHEATKKSWSD